MSAQAAPAGGVFVTPGRTMALATALPPCRFIAEPGIDPALLPDPGAGFHVIAETEEIAADHWLSRIMPRPGPPTVFVTRKPLRTARCRSVFGYADRRARAAVVSLAGLESDSPAASRRRLAAVAAHELGHLAGYRHCRTPGCLMRPARTAEDLDLRGFDLCRSCKRHFRWPLAAGLAVVCLAASLTLDAAIEKVRNRTQVYSWRLDGSAAELMLEREPILRLRSPAAAQAAADALNRLHASMDPPPLRIDSGGGFRIAAGDLTVIALHSIDTGGASAEEFARGWIARMDPLIQGKGTARQGCPSCHVGRRGEVLDAMARRSRWWR